MMVDGTMFGAHRSRLPGSGLEFSQYRSYQPGDDLRRVDWKLFARSDRHFVRESESETSVLVRIVVDATASMDEDVSAGEVAPIEYARLLAAGLALLATRQGDAAGLVMLSDSALESIPPRHDTRQLGRMLHALGAMRPAGRWPAWERVEPVLLGGIGAGRRGITVLITDGQEHAAEIRTAAARLAAVRHDVLLLQVVGPAADRFPYEGPMMFEEAETGQRVEVDAAAARARYLDGNRSDAAELGRAITSRGIVYERVLTAEPLDRALDRVLRARMRSALPR